LFEFLWLAKNLLAKCREAMRLDANSPLTSLEDDTTTSRQSNLIARANTMIASPANPQDEKNIIWQSEMEKGYETLIDTIIPFISDISGVEKLKKK